MALLGPAKTAKTFNLENFRLYGISYSQNLNLPILFNMSSEQNRLYVTLHEKTKHNALKMIFELSATLELVFQQI